MKNLLLLTLSGLLVLGAFTSCDEEKEPTKAIELTGGQTTQSVFADQEQASGGLSFTTNGPWTSTISEGTRAASWISIDPSSGSKAGDYTIAITLEPNYTGADRTATITIVCGDQTIPITVTQKATTASGEVPVETVAVTGVTLDKSTLELTEGESETLTATVAPEDATNKNVEWSSSDEAVATVDAEGKVTAVKAGSATITVTTVDGGKTATCAVTVKPEIDLLSAEYIPDPAFLAYCKEQMPIWFGSLDNDGKLSPAEAAMVTNIVIRMTNVASLVGIEYFTGLTYLTCNNNQLTSLDVSKNTALKELYCSFNPLTTLDVSGCTALTYLNCDYTQLTTLDVSGCTALTTLYCTNSPLTSLDVSGCTALTNLYCGYNQLTVLDVSKNTALTNLSCGSNQLTTLDVSKNTALTYLSCGSNQLTTLDVSKNTALTYLSCGSNQLTTLDVSKNTALTSLDCGSNQLTSLDVSNNTALTYLSCGDNQLTSLDVSNNTALTYLSCGDNQLTSLDVSNNTALTHFDCSGNQLTSLDVSANTALTNLFCTDSQLISIDVSGCTALAVLYCFNNQLTSLDISNNTNLFSKSWVVSFLISGNPGDGVSIFPIKAWFDDNSISEEFPGFWDYSYSWDWNGHTITPHYYTE